MGIGTQGRFWKYNRWHFLCMCLQVEVFWASPLSNLVQMASGLSPRFPAILVSFLCLCFPLSCLPLPPLQPSKTQKLVTWDMQMLRKENNLWTWQNFVFHLLSLLSVRSGDWYGLFSVWWKSPGDMLCRWNGNLSVRRLLRLSFSLSSFFIYIYILLVYTYT